MTYCRCPEQVDPGKHVTRKRRKESHRSSRIVQRCPVTSQETRSPGDLCVTQWCRWHQLNDEIAERRSHQSYSIRVPFVHIGLPSLLPCQLPRWSCRLRPCGIPESLSRLATFFLVSCRPQSASKSLVQVSTKKVRIYIHCCIFWDGSFSDICFGLLRAVWASSWPRSEDLILVCTAVAWIYSRWKQYCIATLAIGCCPVVRLCDSSLAVSELRLGRNRRCSCPC